MENTHYFKIFMEHLKAYHTFPPKKNHQFIPQKGLLYHKTQSVMTLQ